MDTEENASEYATPVKDKADQEVYYEVYRRKTRVEEQADEVASASHHSLTRVYSFLFEMEYVLSLSLSVSIINYKPYTLDNLSVNSSSFIMPAKLLQSHECNSTCLSGCTVPIAVHHRPLIKIPPVGTTALVLTPTTRMKTTSALQKRLHSSNIALTPQSNQIYSNGLRNLKGWLDLRIVSTLRNVRRLRGSFRSYFCIRCRGLGS